jgi:hypothetical protein
MLDIEDTLKSLDPTSRTLIAEVELGMDAKAFLESSIGRYLVGCAQQEIVEAQEELSRVLPWRRRRITELQNRVWRARAFLGWLRDALAAAKSAEATLTEATYER